MMEYTAQSTIERITNTIKEKGYTQKQVYSECGIGEDTVKRMTDKKGISSFYLAKIADFLGVSVDYLLGRNNKEIPTDDKKSAPDDVVRDTIIEKLNDMDDRQLARLQGYLEGLAAAEKE